MVLGILTAIAACPAIIGTTEAVRHGQRQNSREEQRGRKTNLTVSLLHRSEYTSQFDGAYIVLKDHKLWIDTTGLANHLHPFSGYFLPYPHDDVAQSWRKAGFRKAEGMVTTISNDPPFLNWVYVDCDSHEVKFGKRDEVEGHRLGPFDVTKTDRRLTFEGWEGFVAVQEHDGEDLWALYFDVHDDGLTSGERVGTQALRMLALEVWRRELRVDREMAMEERLERIRMRREEEERKSESTTVS
ncbi:uncharacterized protein SEPMUDRAFT_132410 [Sphaerulina musiva SO2202]|uniref:Uncharacterized protein n=1 Tax=Sphaerulina musiva (strain SO2202) TaxID=692275 RepID=M3DAE0_SPHMS|nr:uncharacterized protein SEPMUDRAFT_132410 [Sphaerulina musiva SO2202]EMF14834.1 hypothetical protein SEPMUDRAFT_132410 [Sphaerulina musiva SO2202]